MTLTSATFAAPLDNALPPEQASPPAAALWWARRGHWDRAHAIVQDEPGADAAWVHVHLHRVEGDLGNAAWWYDRAGRSPAQGSLDDERAAIAAALSSASRGR